jgi:predicted neuraminidase
MKKQFLLKTKFAVILTGILLGNISGAYSQRALFDKEEIFPGQHEHAHGSTILELPNGDLLAAWFQGSGERWADDVRILGSRKKHSGGKWSPPFIMADVKGFPDINPVIFIDGINRLWLMWYTVIANQWSTSLLNFRISEDYQEMNGAPGWAWQENLLVKPGDKAEHGILPGDRFVESVKRQANEYGVYLESFIGTEVAASWHKRAERNLFLAEGKDMIRPGRGANIDEQRGYPYFRRIGWQTRAKPVIIAPGRMILPLYSDGFGFAMMAYTDDWGENWSFSEPLVGFVEQPAIAVTGTNELVAFMRHNGPPPRKLQVSRSVNGGENWSAVRYSDFPNPDSAADVVTLEDGSWVLIYNNTETGRHSLVVSLSEDEGESWPWTRQVESGNPGEISAHYPSIIQGRNGVLHVTYSLFRDNQERKNIVYARFTKEWIKGSE